MRKEDFLGNYNAGGINATLRDKLGAVSKNAFYLWLAAFKCVRGGIGTLVPGTACLKRGRALFSRAPKNASSRVSGSKIPSPPL
jgi:hypothetical protein